MSTIQDSGERRSFDTGAVRDITTGKGRCDLMPLNVVARVLEPRTGDYILRAIGKFLETQETKCLYAAISNFCNAAYEGNLETLILELAKHFEDGAEKYGENNWQKGIPAKCYMDSALRHYLKWHKGDTDEPHDRAFVWNLVCCIWEVDYHAKNQ